MSELPHTPVIFLPQIHIADHIESALPLELTTVSAQITGPAASVLVRQRFGNPLKEPAELEYLFPLPEDAAITGFAIQVGERRIVGDLQERESANAAYEAARGEGKRAGLLEQRRPNLFAVRLANVLPGEMVHAEARYQQRLKFEDGAYEFIYPMGLTPKYDSPQHPGEGEGTHAPIAHGEKIGPVEINVTADAGAAINDPVSPSHRLEITRLDERRFQARLAGEHIPDHDLVLRYALAGEEPQAAGWMAQQGKESFFMATLVPPRMEAEGEPLSREFVFVLDRSGSMSGEPIAQARNALRACLRALGHQDTFRILLFDNDLEWFQKEPSIMTQEQVDRADAYLDRVQGRGGTEIVRALEEALNVPADPKRMRFIVFLTDGAVSAEARAVEQIRRQIGSARLFTFGIGSSVNRALLNRMAAIGRGRAEFLQLDEDIEGAIIRFQDSVSFPLITDLSLEWSGVKANDVYPSRLPDLYYGQPLEIVGRIAQTGKKTGSEVTLRGKRAGQPVEVRLRLSEPAGQDPTVARAWAKARVDDLLDQMELEPGRADKLRAEIIGLALEYNLVTTYTAFVGIDSTPVTGGEKPKVIQVAQPLPRGVVPEVYGGGQMPVMANMMMPASAPMTAMPKVMKSLVQRASTAAKGDAPVHRKVGYDRGVAESAQERASAPGAAGMKGEAGLRELARTQNMDGSWGDSVEKTAAALIAFVRAGHTTRSGSYRQVVRRAARWLIDARGREFAEFARYRALHELAETTKDAQIQSAAQGVYASLPIPSTDQEAFAIGKGPDKWKTPASDVDRLRLEALLPGAGPDAVLSWLQGI